MNRSNSSPLPHVPETIQNSHIAGPSIKDLLYEISNLPPEQKMAQIGLERESLGLPHANARIDGRSFFSDNYVSIDPSVKPKKNFLDFPGLPQLSKVIPNMPDETLFFMFFAQPRDKVQELAASELKRRGWRYSKSREVWSVVKNGKAMTFDENNWMEVTE